MRIARKPLLVVILAAAALAAGCDGVPVTPGSASPGSPVSAAPVPTTAPSPAVPAPTVSGTPAPSAAPTVLAATISRIAGIGASGYAGDGGVALTAKFNGPWGLAFDAAGTLWVADSGNSRLRKITKSGDISSGLGTATSGFNGDNITEQATSLSQPYGVAFSASGHTYVADTYANRIRRLDGVTRLVTTVAGIGTGGLRGDGGLATQATLSNPACVVVNSQETLYIADRGNNAIRMVTAGGMISTVVGTGTGGYNGDSKLGSTVSLRFPEGLALDKTGNLYIADGGNSRIRKLTPDGIVRTIVGNGTAGFSGDGGPALAASINRPIGMAVAADGTLFFADADNHRIRMVRPDGTIQTVAGSTAIASANDDGPALQAGFGRPTGLALDADGNLFVTDTGPSPYDQTVRKITFTR